MKKKKTFIWSYIGSALIVITAFLAGFFLSQNVDTQDISRNGRVQLIGAFQKLDVLEKAVQSVEELVGKEKLIVEEQLQGDIESQYMVSLNGTLAPVEQPLQEYGYIITVDDGKDNPFATSVIEGKLPEQYYVLIRENIDGEYDINTYPLHD